MNHFSPIIYTPVPAAVLIVLFWVVLGCCSYGALMSIAIALVRESSALMVGQYFKRRRDFVEIVVQMGAGIGVILFSVFFKEALGLVYSFFL